MNAKLEMAVKATLEKFAEFVTSAAGFKTDKNGEKVLVKNKAGEMVPVLVNARGNISFLYNGVSFADEAEALQYYHDNKIAVADVLASAVNEAKGSAAASAVKEVSEAIPATETINAETLKAWTEKAQTAAHTAADKTIAPEISSRAAKAAVESKLASLISAKQSGEEVNNDDLLALFLQQRSMES